MSVPSGGDMTEGERKEFQRVVSGKGTVGVLSGGTQRGGGGVYGFLKDKITSMQWNLKISSADLKRLPNGSVERCDGIVWVMNDLEYQIVDIDMEILPQLSFLKSTLSTTENIMAHRKQK